MKKSKRVPRSELRKLKKRLAGAERIDAAALARVERQLNELHDTVASERAWSGLASRTIADLEVRVQELEGLWVVARENPDLVRELALQALKGRET